MRSEHVQEHFQQAGYHVLEYPFFDNNAIPYVQVWHAKDRSFKMCCSVVGDWLFLDDRLATTVHGVPEKTVLLSKFRSLLGEVMLGPYAALTAHAMQGVDCSGKTVIDLGCGDGVLSLVALKKGATHVIGVASENKYSSLMRGHMLANNYSAEKYQFIQGNICDEHITDELPVHDIGVVVANLGPHYGTVDVAAVRLLDHLPSCNFFVGGGYSLSNPQYRKSPFSAMHVKHMLREQGFTFFSDVREDSGDQFHRLSFVARRF